MPVTLLVLAIAASASIVVWWASLRPVGPDPVDPATEEQWLLRWLGRHPRWGSLARSVDRRVAGGLMLVVSLAVLLGTALVVGLVFDMVDGNRGLARWDRAVAEWGSTHATGATTRVLETLTDLGGTFFVVVFAVLIALVDWTRHRNPNVPLFLTTVLVGVVVINNVLKLIVDRERPDVVHLVQASGSSFPSGHSATAAAAWCAFALVIARHWSRRGRAIAAGVAAVVAVSVAASRALLGVHWLTDVVAGLMVGWGWFLLCALAFGGRLQRLGEPAERSALVSS